MKTAAQQSIYVSMFVCVCVVGGVQIVHWVHVYVKVNLIRLIKKEHSGLNKLVDRSQRGLRRVAG